MTAPRPADADAAVRAWLTTPTAQLAADVVVVGRELGPWVLSKVLDRQQAQR